MKLTMRLLPTHSRLRFAHIYRLPRPKNILQRPRMIKGSIRQGEMFIPSYTFSNMRDVTFFILFLDFVAQ